MTPTLFVLQVAVLFLPGVIWAHLDTKYASKRDDGQLWFLLRAMMFGIASHGFTWFLYWAVSQEYLIPNLVIANEQTVITDRIGWQVFWATLSGFLLAIVWMYVINYKLLTQFLQLIRATKTYGDEDVWDFTLNSSNDATSYVHVRDFENQLVYAGWVNVFSESGKLRELVLTDVEVFALGDTTTPIYTTPRLYLARKPEGLHIEFPAQAEHTMEGA